MECINGVEYDIIDWINGEEIIDDYMRRCDHEKLITSMHPLQMDNLLNVFIIHVLYSTESHIFLTPGHQTLTSTKQTPANVIAKL